MVADCATREPPAGGVAVARGGRRRGRRSLPLVEERPNLPSRALVSPIPPAPTARMPEQWPEPQPVGPTPRLGPPPQRGQGFQRGRGDIRRALGVNSHPPTLPAPQSQNEAPAASPSLQPIPVPQVVLRVALPRTISQPVQRGNDSVITSASLRTPSVSTINTPPPISLKRVAEDASVLLELFSQSSPDHEDDVGTEHHTMIATAAAGIFTIQARFRQSAARRNGDIDSFARQEDSSQDGTGSFAIPRALIRYLCRVSIWWCVR